MAHAFNKESRFRTQSVCCKSHIDMSLVWFGVVVVVMMAIGTITPPLGLNCFVMKGALGDEYELKDIFAGSLPFVILMLFTVALLIVYPEICLWLPELMKSMR